MSEVDLDAIEARVALASPAPWSVLPAMVQNEAGQWSPPEVIGIAPYGYDDGDVEFIAHSRQDIPAMVAEIRRLRAQVDSFTNKTVSTPANADPDDTDADLAIEEAEDFLDAALELGDKWDVPYTNNYPRWQNGQFLRHMGDWLKDVRKVAKRYHEEEVARGDTEG